MHYQKVVSGLFISRPNRFIAHVEINGKEEIVHVKNTGRCKELLVPGVTVYLEDFEGRMGSRKLRYSLIAVEKIIRHPEHAGANCEAILINMDSQAPNSVIKEEFQKSGIFFKPEYSYKNSRFDFYFEKKNDVGNTTKGFLEVKGCTLENEGHCKFPDAPTERGVKHLQELIEAKEQGYWAGILILIQMEQAKDFSPNDETHKAFGDALRLANKKGVQILCYNCKVTPDSLVLKDSVNVIL